MPVATANESRPPSPPAALPPGRPAVLPLAEVGAGDPALVGAKAQRLGSALAAGFPVPDGFVVTTAALRAFLEGPTPGAGPARPLREAIAEDLRALADPRRAPETAERVRALIDGAPVPPALEAEVRAALARLEGAPVAVRSSALAEDGAASSLAGHFDSFLDVRGEAAVLDALRRCWASAASERALAARLRGAAPSLEMAVLVQRMVRGGGGGVLFTRDPRGRHDRMIAEISPVGAEGVAGGEHTPHRIAIDRASGEILEGASGEAGEAALAADLARMGARLEERFHGPQDVEWARGEGGRLALLQTRPIVAAASGVKRLDRWTAANSQEAIEDPVTPLTYTLLAPMIDRGRAAAFAVLGVGEVEGAYMRRFDGRIYFNVDYFRRFLERVPGAPPEIFDLLIFGDAGEIEVPRPPLRALPRLLSVARTAWHHWSYALPRMDRFIVRLGRRVRRLAGRRLRDLPDEGLLAQLDLASKVSEAALNYHVLGTAMAGGHYLVLQKLLKHCGLGLPGNAADELLAGAPGIETARSNAAIFELARLAGRLPEVRALVLREEPERALALLSREGPGEVPGAAEMRRALEEFLDRYGHRSESEAELAAPRWREEPGFILRAVRRSLEVEAAGGGAAAARRSPLEAQAALAARGKALARRIERGLAARGPVVGGAWRLAFRFLHDWAERAAPYRENLRFHALRGLEQVRRVLVEVGRRLAQRGVLESAGEVFFLEAEEALGALRRGALSDDERRTLRARALARAAEHRDSLGRADPPKLLYDDGSVAPLPVRAERGARVAGRGAPLPPPVPEGVAVARTLEGVPVSSGLVTGRARKVERIEDGWSLAPDEILLARAATPSWTPLFFFARGVILDIGGMLSHCAVIAREYGIPCVVGLKTAVADIPDGATVTVDAYHGRVYVHAPPQVELSD